MSQLGTILLRPYDGLAQRAHATGVGIIENDVPISFHEKYVESLVA